MRTPIALLVTLVVLAETGVFAANILYLDLVVSPSHFGWNRALMYGLAARGHNVTVVSVDVDRSPPPNVTFIHLEGVYEKLGSEYEETMDFFEMAAYSVFEMHSMFVFYMLKSCELALQTEGVNVFLDYPSDFRFDVIINDYLTGPCLAAVAHHRFKQPPYIAVTAFHAPSTTNSMTGAYTYSGLVPNHEYDAPEQMTYRQRFVNFLANMYEEWLRRYSFLPAMNELVRAIDPTIPDVALLDQQTKIVLLNSNPVIQYSEPSMPNVIPVGGMQIVPSKKLPADIDAILRSAKNGVILFSLGTNIRSDMLGKERLLEILTTMEQLPQYEFLWKFESDTLPKAAPKNVHIRPWMPQNDLLAHPNLKLFITHSGLLSTQEAIWHGVPIIGFPVFADQYRNINYCVERGVGKRLHIATLNAHELLGAIRDVMADGSYRENMQRMSRLFRDQPEHPLDRAIWWVEWVLRNPTQTELMSHGSRLCLLQKYSFDVLIPLFAAVAISCHLLVALVRRLFFRRPVGVRPKRD